MDSSLSVYQEAVEIVFPALARFGALPFLPTTKVGGFLGVF